METIKVSDTTVSTSPRGLDTEYEVNFSVSPTQWAKFVEYANSQKMSAKALLRKIVVFTGNQVHLR